MVQHCEFLPSRTKQGTSVMVFCHVYLILVNSLFKKDASFGMHLLKF